MGFPAPLAAAWKKVDYSTRVWAGHTKLPTSLSASPFLGISNSRRTESLFNRLKKKKKKSFIFSLLEEEDFSLYYAIKDFRGSVLREVGTGQYYIEEKGKKPASTLIKCANHTKELGIA